MENRFKIKFLEEQLKSILQKLLILILALLVLSFFLSFYSFFFVKLSENYTPNSIAETFRVFLFAQEYLIPLKLKFETAFIIFSFLNLFFLTLTFFKDSKLKLGYNKEYSLPLIITENFVFTTFILALIRWILKDFLMPIPPIQDALLALTLSTIAPIREEIGYRLTLIGFPLAILMIRSLSLKSFFKFLWKPNPKLFYFRGIKIRFLVYILLIFSSLLFGLGHLQSYKEPLLSAKVIEAMISGFILGYFYIKEGFHACVTLHILFNYFSLFFYLGGEFRFDILAYYLLLFAGIVSFYRKLNLLFKERTKIKIF
ncbi:MAG: CPBP family glutamic-type intramembrane protease [Nitrososphaerales archaeon]